MEERVMSTTAKLLVLMLFLGMVSADSGQAGVDDGDKPVISVTPFLGGAFWDEDLGLEDDLIYGGRLGLHFLRNLSLEASYGLTTAETTVGGSDVDVEHFGVDLVYDLLSSSRFNPYLTGGWAQLNTQADGSTTTHNLNGWEAGAGLKIRLMGENASPTSLRLEVRDVMADLPAMGAIEGGFSHNLMATAGLQFAFGCSSKDDDLDGVRNQDDDCPDTPAGANVDLVGCPSDSDADGIYDGLDKCASTPAGATVDAYGCPKDSDGDGIYDGLDKCSATPANAVVDAGGCPLDSDHDGVFDGIDECPDTAAHLQVDVKGCPIAVTTTEIELLDTGSISTSQIVFLSGSAELDGKSTEILNEIGETLTNWPTLRIEIGGHTDSTGSAGGNQRLSERRAAAVLAYLGENFSGISIQNFEVKGYGEVAPITGNETAEDRAMNRRVEFKVLNKETLKKEIENRKLLER
jgi:OmpA-OmpF porin, OOP family